MIRGFNQGWTKKKQNKTKHQSIEEYLKNGGTITKCASKTAPDETQIIKSKGQLYETSLHCRTI